MRQSPGPTGRCKAVLYRLGYRPMDRARYKACNPAGTEKQVTTRLSGVRGCFDGKIYIQNGRIFAYLIFSEHKTAESREGCFHACRSSPIPEYPLVGD